MHGSGVKAGCDESALGDLAPSRPNDLSGLRAASASAAGWFALGEGRPPPEAWISMSDRQHCVVGNCSPRLRGAGLHVSDFCIINLCNKITN